MTMKLLARAFAGAFLLSSTALPAFSQEPAAEAVETPAETPAPAPSPAEPASGEAPAAAPAADPAAPAADPAAPAAEVPAEPADPATVVARVGDSEITEGDLAAAVADLGQQFAQLPPEQRRVAVLAALIDIRSLSVAAQEAGLENDPLVERRIAFLRDRALHNAYFEKNGVEAITDEELRARYDTEVGATEPVQEVNARHILVPTREEAEAVIDELDGGAEFAALATERSSDPSSQQGGDLGFFGPGQMVPAFEAAAFALEPGSYTPEPVESQFGWHVIEVIEKREATPPPFEQVREQVMQIVMRETYIELVQAARANLEVEYLDPELQTQIEAMEAMIAGAGAAGEPEAATPEETPAAAEPAETPAPESEAPAPAAETPETPAPEAEEPAETPAPEAEQPAAN